MFQNKRQRAVGRNWLDNGTFQIEQRGAGAYSSAGFTADRWYLTGSKSVVVTPTTGTFTMSNASTYVYQTLPPDTVNFLSGKNVTLTALVDVQPGSVLSIGIGYGNSSATNPSAILTTRTTSGILTATFTYPGTGAERIFFYTSSSFSGSVSVRGVKLEIGGFQSLARYNGSAWDVIDKTPYAEDLLRCQRYYQRITAGTGNAVGFGTGYSSTNILCTFPLAAPMVSGNPTMAVSSGSISLVGEGGTIAYSATAVRGNQSAVSVGFTVTGATQYRPYIAVAAANTVIEFSNEI